MVTDATGVVRSRSRTFDHAPAPRAVDDPILHEKVGTLAATAWIAESAVLTAADAVQAAMDAAARGEPTEDVRTAAALAHCSVKIDLDQVGLEAASDLFDVGGRRAAPATSTGTGATCAP